MPTANYWVETVAYDLGIWCRACALASGVKATAAVYPDAADPVVSLLTFSRCLSCLEPIPEAAA